MKFSIKAAYKFLINNLKVNLLIFFTVLIGIAMQFFIFNLSSVLKHIIIKQVVNYQEHIVLTTKTQRKSKKSDYDLVNEILTLDNVDDAHLYVYMYGTLTKENGQVVPFYIHNLYYQDRDPNQYLKTYGVGLEENILKGHKNDATLFELVVDDAFFTENNLKLGEKVTFYNSHSNKSETYTITGTYHREKYNFVNNQAYVSSNVFDHNFRTKQKINIILKDPFNVDSTINQIKNLTYFNDSFEISSYEEDNNQMLELNFIQQLIIGFIQILISLVVLIIVVHVIHYIIERKYKEIGILKAMGINNTKLMFVFLFQTLIVQTFASISGLSLGRSLLAYYHKIMVDPYTGRHRFSYEITFSQYFITFTSMLLIGITASIYSYYKVSKLSIIDLIKL